MTGMIIWVKYFTKGRSCEGLALTMGFRYRKAMV